ARRVWRPSASRPMGHAAGVLAANAVAVGLGAVLLVPAAWALSSVLVPGPGAIPSADLARLVPAVGDAPALSRTVEPYDTSGLVAFLEANHAGERYLLATTTTRLAAPIIIRSRHSGMAVGGFPGAGPIPSPGKAPAGGAARPGPFGVGRGGPVLQPLARRRGGGAPHRRVGAGQGAAGRSGSLALEPARRPPQRHASLRSEAGRRAPSLVLDPHVLVGRKR